MEVLVQKAVQEEDGSIKLKQRLCVKRGEGGRGIMQLAVAHASSTDQGTLTFELSMTQTFTVNNTTTLPAP